MFDMGQNFAGRELRGRGESIEEKKEGPTGGERGDERTSNVFQPAFPIAIYEACARGNLLYFWNGGR